MEETHSKQSLTGDISYNQPLINCKKIGNIIGGKIEKESGAVAESAGTHPVESGFLWRHSESNQDPSLPGNARKSSQPKNAGIEAGETVVDILPVKWLLSLSTDTTQTYQATFILNLMVKEVFYDNLIINVLMPCATLPDTVVKGFAGSKWDVVSLFESLILPSTVSDTNVFDVESHELLPPLHFPPGDTLRELNTAGYFVQTVSNYARLSETLFLRRASLLQVRHTLNNGHSRRASSSSVPPQAKRECLEQRVIVNLGSDHKVDAPGVPIDLIEIHTALHTVFDVPPARSRVDIDYTSSTFT
ncbi:hypothetical protein WN51_03341 [Melipona quadrifasciata]|uniref:Uncharacterized protein n=1 Tax=Melipona quadrifasciata TaxID=166423 RepID=A0A0N0BDU2_9HYME|nr:hypothetical protein WN51_03341 [Melipona quadrifasciata]